MPVNQTLFNKHLDALRAAQGEPDWQDTADKLARSYGFLEDLQIQEGMESVIITGYDSEDDLAAAQLLEGEPARHWRFRLMNQLARLRQQMAHTHPSDGDAIQAVRREHQGMTGAMEWLVKQDREPPMRYVPFAQSEIARQAIKREADVNNDPDQARVRLREYQASVISDYIKSQLPPARDGEQPARLTDRETFAIGKDIWSVAAHLSSDDSPSLATARLFSELLNERRMDHRGKVDGNGKPVVIMAAFWDQVSNAGFDKHLDKHVSPAMKSHLLLQDRLPVRDVLNWLHRTVKDFRLSSVEVSYLETINGDHSPIMALTEPSPEHARVEVIGTEAINRPLLATQWHPDAPNHIAITSPGRGVMVTHLPDGEDADARMARIQEVATELPISLNPMQAQKRLDRIKQAWYDLPTDDQAELASGLNAIERDIKTLARQLPPPGMGSAKYERVTTDLVKLPLLMGRDRHLMDLEFAPPKGLGSIPTDQRPDRFVDRINNGDGTTDVVFDRAGSAPGTEPERLRGIPNEQVRASIAGLAAENNWTLGTRPTGLPGYSVYAPSQAENPERNVFIGHWMSKGERDLLLKHKPIGLLHRTTKGTPLFESPALGEPRRNEEDAERMKYATINMMHDGETEPMLIHGAYDTASYDGDFLVELADDDGWPACSGTQIAIPPELFQHASDKELKTAISQLVALSNAPENLKAEILDHMRTKTWDQALDEADYFMSMDMEPEPMPDELPGMM
ncbi:MAG: Uncharacterized protein AWU57_315 [Marinobacter sp. T13-3]|nr:MAG: Uncharacterized protein AWU57_315 [Marinobacter sp. T13-3]